MRYSTVFVVCPANAMSAGPEALHQLVADLNGLGQRACIVYHPFNRTFATPVPYRKYCVPVADYTDEAGTILVFPEIFPTLPLRVKRADAAIWWMSVNNYTCVRYDNPLRDKISYAKNLLRGKRPWRGISALGHLRHYAQSFYAERFLEEHGLNANALSDNIPVYLEPRYLADIPRMIAARERRDVVLYSPRKGAHVVARLRSAYPRWQFRPLEGLDRAELADAFLGAKLYVDFGHHPGKDRLPREAAIHGCCVITSRYGSAANPVDVPIPERYKLAVTDARFVETFGERVADIFGQYETRNRDFDGYRGVIAEEGMVFVSQIKKIFGLTESAKA